MSYVGRTLAIVLVTTFIAVNAVAQGSSADSQKCARIAPVEPVKPNYPVDPPPGRPELPPESEKQYQLARDMESCGYAKDAIRVYRHAARAGNGKAAARLAKIFDCGAPGVSRDYAEALRWHEAARKLGESVPDVGRSGQC
jgi:TPR repeat protein